MQTIRPSKLCRGQTRIQVYQVRSCVQGQMLERRTPRWVHRSMPSHWSARTHSQRNRETQLERPPAGLDRRKGGGLYEQRGSVSMSQDRRTKNWASGHTATGNDNPLHLLCAIVRISVSTPWEWLSRASSGCSVVGTSTHTHQPSIQLVHWHIIFP